jgi:hypothetical protein
MRGLLGGFTFASADSPGALSVLELAGGADAIEAPLGPAPPGGSPAIDAGFELAGAELVGEVAPDGLAVDAEDPRDSG